MRGILSAVLLLSAAAAPPALAVDSDPPNYAGFTVTDCEGVQLPGAILTSTGTPDIRLTIKDVGSSGLRLGNVPHTGGANAMQGTALLLHLDNNATDDSGNNHTVTPTSINYGNTAPDQINSSYGYSALWNAVGDRLRITASPALNSTTSSLTIQAWIKPTGLGAQPIFEWNDTSRAGVHFWMGTPDNNGRLYVNLVDTPTYTNHGFYSPPNVVVAGQWQLVTMSFHRPTRVVTLFRNDVMVASGTLSITDNLATGFDAWVGYRANGSTTFDGRMDEVRVLNVALDEVDVAADYYSGRFMYSDSSDGPWTNTNLDPVAHFEPDATQGMTTDAFLVLTRVPLLTTKALRFIYQDRAGNTSSLRVESMSVTVSAPTVPRDLFATPQSASSILWTWSKPGRLCLNNVSPVTYGTYNVLRGSDGNVMGGPISSPTTTFTESAGLLPNTLYSRLVQAYDAYGTSPLSGSASAYTHANPPTSMQSSNITTTGLDLGWSNNSNPLAYTRYEVTLWNADFTTIVSTPVAFEDDHVALAASLNGLSPGTTYYIRVRAKNGRSSDSYGGTNFTSYLSTTIPTVPSGPAPPTGDPTGTTSILWSWTAVPGALRYDLESSPGVYLAQALTGLGFSQTGLQPNTSYQARLRVSNQSGTSAYSAYSSSYTDARPPTGTDIPYVSSGSLRVSWGGNLNPDPTTYEVHLATDSAFAGTVRAKTTTAYSENFHTLLPGSTYYARVRALSSNSRASAWDGGVSVWRVTPVVGPITSTGTAVSPYIPDPLAKGVWHFDASSGTVAVDSSGYANHGAIASLWAGVATPTWTSGMAGLGGALSFTTGRVSVPHAASLSPTGALTVEAWLNPSWYAQADGTTVLSKGLAGAERYALNIDSNRRWRFRVNGAVAVSSTQTIATGRWVHVVGVYNPSTSLSIYVDGVLSSSTSVGVPASLSVETGELTIGAQKTGAAAYGNNFYGLIDEVQVLAKALTPSQATADFHASNGYSTVSSPGAIAAQVNLRPDAFAGPVTLMFSSDPELNGIDVSRPHMRGGLDAPPNGMTLVPNTLIEIVATQSGFIHAGTLGSSATVSLPYADADGNTLVDGTDPPLSAQRLRMYTLDPSIVGRWHELPSTVDLASKRVVGVTSHFSVFALFGVTGVSPGTQDVYIYPVPWKPGSGGSFDSATWAGRTGLAIANLPASGSVRIFTLSGEMVVELSFAAIDLGTIIWDGKNHSGRDVASGVYFAYVKGSNDSSKVLKFAIER